MSASASWARPSVSGINVNTRALRTEYLSPDHVSTLAESFRVLEEEYMKRNPPVRDRMRFTSERFGYFFPGELLPVDVFVHALKLDKTETVNSVSVPFDANLAVLRDQLVWAYKPVFSQLRKFFAKEIRFLSPKLVDQFVNAWLDWEDQWLIQMEAHAVSTLQPLAKAILALEPLLIAKEKEKLLPYPRVIAHKAVTLQCLDGFLKSLGELSAAVLSSLKRDADPDPQLLVLIEHLLTNAAPQEASRSMLSGLSDLPDVTFATTGDQLSLSAYAFRLSGPGDIERILPLCREVLANFEELKEFLMSLKSTLTYISPELEMNHALVRRLTAFEKSYKRAKRVLLEPDNLI